MKKNIKIFISIVVIGLTLGSCEQFLEPEMDNRLSYEEMKEIPNYFEGLLLHAYEELPQNYNFNSDVASDDAVTNDKGSNFLKVATGEWKSTFNPLSVWDHTYQQLLYINQFIADYDEVEWSWQDPVVNERHMQRLRGEAFGLRAWYEFELLKSHGGRSASGELLGFPIVTRPLNKDDDYISMQRNSFAECVEQIMEDLDTAIANLPNRYYDIPRDVLHNSTFGERFRNRMNGLAAKILKTRVALWAASPAFEHYTWEEAATMAGDILNEAGGPEALPPEGNNFYHVDNIESEENVWARARFDNNNLERDNFPPSKFGQGRVNPTQELVEIFPMASGVPIYYEIGGNPISGYNPNDPYTGRDPRLKQYILVNNDILKGDPIITAIDSTDDGVNELQSSTRTGYYLKKLLDEEGVSLDPQGIVTQSPHTFTYVRFTELLLNFAEAANEAWGPTDDPNGYGFNAKSVLKAIRIRAGIPQVDTYLDFFVNDQDEMRKVIRNERRIELCFEGFRFWDIRRWNETEIMKSPVSGIFIDYDSEEPYSDIQVVEQRLYEDYMIYGPIPYNEVLKVKLVQNQGWE